MVKASPVVTRIVTQAVLLLESLVVTLNSFP